MLLDSRRHDLKLLLGLIGLAQGFALYLLVQKGVFNNGLDAVSAGLIVFALAAPLAVYIGYDPDRTVASTAFALAVGAVLGLALGVNEALVGHDGLDTGVLYLADFLTIAITGCVALAFFQTWLAHGRKGFPYEDLFEHGWTNAMLILVAAIYTGVVWLVLRLWAALFKILDITIFDRVFTDSLFVWVFTGFAVAVSFALAREHAKLVYAIRSLCITLARILAPVVAVVAILFLAVLPVTGLATLWKTSAATPILLTLIGLSILLMTGVVNDGKSDLAVPKPALWLIAVELALMPILAGLALYATTLRVQQYGLTPARIHALIIVVIAAAHAIGYCYGVLRYRSRWSEWVARINPPLAIGVVAVVLLMQMPWINPYAVSVRDQMARLTSGKVDIAKFDYGIFKFYLGKYGSKALDRIAADTTLPDQDALHESLNMLTDSNEAYQWQARRRGELGRATAEDVAKAVTTIPADLKIPDDLVDAIAKSQAFAIRRCKTSTLYHCVLVPMDIDGDGTPEYLYAATGGLTPFVVIFAQNTVVPNGGWLLLRSRITGLDPGTSNAFMQALIDGKATLSPPRYPDVKVGPTTIQIIP